MSSVEAEHNERLPHSSKTIEAMLTQLNDAQKVKHQSLHYPLVLVMAIRYSHLPHVLDVRAALVRKNCLNILGFSLTLNT